MKGNEIGKEIILALLTLIAVMLVVFAILYSFSPMNKIIPEEITYATSDDVKAMLSTGSGVKPEDTIETYELGQGELNTFQATNDYRPGKVNPFSTYVVQEKTEESGDGTTVDSTSGSTGSSSGSKSSGGTSSSSYSRNTPVAPGEVNPGNYAKDKGLK